MRTVLHSPLPPHFLALVHGLRDVSLGNMNLFTLDINMSASQERLYVRALSRGSVVYAEGGVNKSSTEVYIFRQFEQHK